MHWSLADLVADLAANAVEASAALIEVRVAEQSDRIVVEVEDNGCGMTPEALALATDPFATSPEKHPGRAVGLGLAFLRQTAEATGGRWWLESTPGEGTRAGIQIPAGAVDAPATGDLRETFVQLLSADGECQITIERETPLGRYTLNRRELQEILEDEPGDMSRAGNVSLLREYVASQEEAVWEK